MAEVVLQTERLTKRYGALTAVKAAYDRPEAQVDDQTMPPQALEGQVHDLTGRASQRGAHRLADEWGGQQA